MRKRDSDKKTMGVELRTRRQLKNLSVLNLSTSRGSDSLMRTFVAICVASALISPAMADELLPGIAFSQFILTGYPRPDERSTDERSTRIGRAATNDDDGVRSPPP